MSATAAAYTASVWVLPILLAVTLHEAAHGWAALKLGDPTAKLLGRVSFNPFRHIDLIGTVIVPAILVLGGARFLFGWAKPVPVDPRRLRRPRRDMALVAAAGPAANLIIAIFSALLFHILPLLPTGIAEWAAWNLRNSIMINLFLAVLNMLPLPPLDGGRVAVGLLPKALADPLARLERFGLLILVSAVFIVPMLSEWMGLRVNILGWLVGGPVAFLAEAIAAMAGLNR